jgi:nucleoside-diphosphate-sugar epimerase
MPTALVTGGAGFIGSHLCAHLDRMGWKIVCVDDFSTGHVSNLASVPRAHIIEADVNDDRFWKNMSGRSFDVVFHYAATVGVRLTEEQPLQVLEDAAGIRHVTNFALAGRAKKVVFASSSEVYGDAAQIPFVETNTGVTWNPYTAIKLYGENMMSYLSIQHGIPAFSLRFFNVYGPRQVGSDYGFVISKFIQQAYSRQPLTIYGNGHQTRDFMYVQDNVALTFRLLYEPRVHGSVLNLGTGQETSIKTAAQTIIETSGNPDLMIKFLPPRQHDVQRRCASTGKLQELLEDNFYITPFSTGIGLTFEWFQQKLKQPVNY